MAGDLRQLRIGVLQHVPFEGPARIGEWFRLRGHLLVTVRLWAGDRIPRPHEIDLLVVMGGPMSVSDADRYPWLPAEIAAVRACIDAGLPTLGVCLGAQLIAAALDAAVYPAPQKEIGWWPVDFVPAHGSLPAEAVGLLRTFPARLIVMHWHGDTFDLPYGAIRLASTSICVNQAFIHGDRVIGLQFHLESTMDSVTALTTASRDDIGRGHRQIAARDPVAAMRSGALAHGGTTSRVLFRILDYLCDTSR